MVSFRKYTYKSTSGAISNNRGLRIESEDNDELRGASLRASLSGLFLPFNQHPQ